MKRTYVKGYYGYENLGDDIFVVTAEWVFKNIFITSSPIFLGENLPVLSKESNALRIKNMYLRKLVEICICLKANTILYYGGSLFTDGGKNILDIKYHFRKMKFPSKKFITIGTSIGPFKDKNDCVTTKELLGKFDVIAVRDYSSTKLLKKMNLEEKASFVFDNAILVNEVFKNLKKRELKYEKKLIKIGISLCRYETYQNINIEIERQREESLQKMLDKIIKENENVTEFVFFEFNGNPKTGDMKVTKKFYEYYKEKIKVSIVKYTKNTEEMIEELYNCDFIIGIRLHSGILAYALNIPFMLIEYHTKCTEFLNTINHNYRFNIDDDSQNIRNFDTIKNAGFVPNITDPNYFKNIMLNELEKVKEFI